MKLVIIELGPEWLSYFRIGASGVIDNIKQRLKQLNTWIFWEKNVTFEFIILLI